MLLAIVGVSFILLPQLSVGVGFLASYYYFLALGAAGMVAIYTWFSNSLSKALRQSQ